MKLTIQQEQLLEIVKDQHAGQKRKYTGEGFWTHPYAVAEIISDVVKEPGLLIEVALCHDLYEDANVTPEMLEMALNGFGYTLPEQKFILEGVEALTDIFTPETFPFMNREHRKKHETKRLGAINPAYQSVKYADMIHNTTSLVEHDKGFAPQYLAEKRGMLNVMRLGDLDLFTLCYTTLVKSEGYLGSKEWF